MLLYLYHKHNFRPNRQYLWKSLNRQLYLFVYCHDFFLFFFLQYFSTLLRAFCSVYFLIVVVVASAGLNTIFFLFLYVLLKVNMFLSCWLKFLCACYELNKQDKIYVSYLFFFTLHCCEWVVLLLLFSFDSVLFPNTQQCFRKQNNNNFFVCLNFERQRMDAFLGVSNNNNLKTN